MQIAPDDPSHQDAIASIASDDRHIYAFMEYRHDQVERPNFFVIDRTTHKITRRTRLESGGLPLADRGKLMVCGCHFTDDQACAELDSRTRNLTALPGKLRGKAERIPKPSLLPI